MSQFKNKSVPGRHTFIHADFWTSITIHSVCDQALLSDRVALQSVLLRHVTRGALHSLDFPPGPTPLVTGAGERVTVTAFPNQVTLTSVLAVSHIIDVDNDASNGVIHVVDSVF